MLVYKNACKVERSCIIAASAMHKLGLFYCLNQGNFLKIERPQVPTTIDIGSAIMVISKTKFGLDLLLQFRGAINLVCPRGPLPSSQSTAFQGHDGAILWVVLEASTTCIFIPVHQSIH